MTHCKAFITTTNGKKTRRCKKSASVGGFCFTHRQRRTTDELVVADALVTLSQTQQTDELSQQTSYTPTLFNYKDTINSMERDYNNSMEFLNIEFQKLKSHLTLHELDKMDVLCAGAFEKYEDYSNSLKHDIDNQLDYYENIIERLYEDRKILVSNMKCREEQMEEMKRLVSDARERLTYLHELLTL